MFFLWVIQYLPNVVFAHVDPIGESVDTENVKEKLIKTVEDAKTTYQKYEDKCNAKEVIMDAFWLFSLN